MFKAWASSVGKLVLAQVAPMDADVMITAAFCLEVFLFGLTAAVFITREAHRGRAETAAGSANVCTEKAGPRVPAGRITQRALPGKERGPIEHRVATAASWRPARSRRLPPTAHERPRQTTSAITHQTRAKRSGDEVSAGRGDDLRRAAETGEQKERSS